MRRVTQFGKLVRGRIPDIIRKNGGYPVTRVLSRNERRGALIGKLREEIGELESATLTSPRDKVLEEAADIYEVLITLVNEVGYVDQDLFTIARSKRMKRGSFDAGIWLESVEAEEDNS